MVCFIGRLEAFVRRFEGTLCNCLLHLVSFDLIFHILWAVDPKFALKPVATGSRWKCLILSIIHPDCVLFCGAFCLFSLHNWRISRWPRSFTAVEVVHRIEPLRTLGDLWWSRIEMLWVQLASVRSTEPRWLSRISLLQCLVAWPLYPIHKSYCRCAWPTDLLLVLAFSVIVVLKLNNLVEILVCCLVVIPIWRGHQQLVAVICEYTLRVMRYRVLGARFFCLSGFRVCVNGSCGFSWLKMLV